MGSSKLGVLATGPPGKSWRPCLANEETEGHRSDLNMPHVRYVAGFPDGTVVKNPPAISGDTEIWV